MEESKFQELLAVNKAVIVHFSHFAEMAHAVEFPCDLQHAISAFENETRSCCAISPGHSMDLPGAVGVIFAPTFEQVLSVLAHDSGSSDFGGTENSGGNFPTEKTIVDSFDAPYGGYNEWRIRGANPIGIFVANPSDITVKKKQELSFNGEHIVTFGCESISLSSVHSSFLDLQIFTMSPNGLVKITPIDT